MQEIKEVIREAVASAVLDYGVPSWDILDENE